MRSPRPGVLRWWIISLVTLRTILNYLSRSSLAVAAPTLKSLMSITTQQYSWVVAGFQGAYTIAQPFAGYVLDRVGMRIGFAMFAVGWSLAHCAHALASGWQGLAVFRGFVGVTEAPTIPAGVKVASEWFPPQERTIATGWFSIGSSLGSMIAPPLVLFCIYMWGWQSVFVVTGGIGFIWAAVWYCGYRPPAEHPRLSHEELNYISSTGKSAHHDNGGTTWLDVLKTKEFWSIAIPRFLADPAWHTFSFFMPLYLVEARGLDLQIVAATAWLPFLAADAGSLLGGYFAPWLIRRFGVSLLASRKTVVTVGTICMIGPACIGLTATPGEAIALFCVGGFAHQMLSGALMTLTADVFQSNVVATASGMTGSAAWIGGLSFSLVIGALADTIGYGPLFASLLLLDIAGSIVLWTLLDSRASRVATASR